MIILRRSLAALSSKGSRCDLAYFSSTTKKPRLRLLTKKNCSLCEEEKIVLWKIPGIGDRLQLEEVNILKEGNEELFDLYRYEIPVFFLGNKFVSKNRLDTEKLLKLLDELEN